MTRAMTSMYREAFTGRRTVLAEWGLDRLLSLSFTACAASFVFKPITGNEHF